MAAVADRGRKPLLHSPLEKPDAIDALTGAIARSPFVIGEPLREAKLIKANGSGYMAAVLDKGMRAISTEISPKPARAASSCRTIAST